MRWWETNDGSYCVFDKINRSTGRFVNSNVVEVIIILQHKLSYTSSAETYGRFVEINVRNYNSHRAARTGFKYN